MKIPKQDHVYVESSRANRCLFCGLAPERHPSREQYEADELGTHEQFDEPEESEPTP